MSDTDLYKIIKLLDAQISKLNPNDSRLQPVATPLIQLRNNILTEFNPISNTIDWSIKEPQALKILKRLNYIKKYE
jgi:hypothetical protein